MLMQLSDSDETAPKNPEKSKSPVKLIEGNGDYDDNHNDSTEEGLTLDVSGKDLEFPLLKNSSDTIEEFYMYKNEFNLVPKSLGCLGKLRTFKFFGNEINLFPEEFENLVGLECLQVKISSPKLNGISLRKLEGLKELELSKVPRRLSAFPLLTEIAGLKSLTKLSICHFSIRYLPPEIGYLSKLEYLDLSFNKMKSLPAEISYLSALIALKVANNKLEELHSGLSSLRRLESLDLSNNRLTSLGDLELLKMHNLQNLNLQYNRLFSVEIPSWICCNLEGNGRDALNDDSTSSSVEMDIYESVVQDDDGSLSCNGPSPMPSSLSSAPPSTHRCFAARRSGKHWKRRHYLQQRARQERLNNSRKLKGEDSGNYLIMKPAENCNGGNSDSLETEFACLDEYEREKLHARKFRNDDILTGVEDDGFSSEKRYGVETSSSAVLESVAMREGRKSECSESDVSLAPSKKEILEQGEELISDVSKVAKSKRHSDRDLDNPKPCKFRRPIDDSLYISRKYSSISFCGIKDHLVDGFYDAGRDRPFMLLRSYEQSLNLESREVILVDRARDEELDAIVLSAKALVRHLKRFNGFTKDKAHDDVNNLQLASLLALFVSDHFGGSDRSSTIEKSRKDVSGSNYEKPFVCTCSTGNCDSICTSSNRNLDNAGEDCFSDLCERSLRSIKTRRNSIVVPLGTLQFGVCRHRALLMKYLCDRMEPPVPCELVRGYLDFMPHAWNTVLTKRGDSWVRMLVDACRPLDIREETDPEFFCRYIPLSRTKVSESGDIISEYGSFPSLSACDEIENAASSSLIRCQIGSDEAAAKVRTLEVDGVPIEEIRNFEYTCIGEVRILGVLKHPCIVEMYGHQISSKWVPSGDGKSEHRILKSAILMEYVKGGPLKGYLEKLLKAGEKNVPVDLALCIARDVACALAELHSKHIIHRDIKSENILIDLERGADEMPVVKLCDFDRAVPLRSYLHTCCIAHIGIPPPDVCVGTPRWMAPEVLQAMHEHNRYGLEVDIWSYGCLLLELLTLQVPYFGLSDAQIHDSLQMGKRPRLTDEMEALRSLKKPNAQSETQLRKSEGELEKLTFLVDLFYCCTEHNPTDRPTAESLCEMLFLHTDRLTEKGAVDCRQESVRT